MPQRELQSCNTTSYARAGYQEHSRIPTPALHCKMWISCYSFTQYLGKSWSLKWAKRKWGKGKRYCPLSELLHLINIPSQYLGSHYLFLIRSIFHFNFVSSASAEDNIFNHTTVTQCLSSSFPVTGIKCHCQQPPSDSHFQCQEQEPVPAQIPYKWFCVPQTLHYSGA